jgi:hypothetical protein
MGQQFRLAVKPVVEFPVEFSINDSGKTKKFSFTVIGERIAADVLREEVVDNGEGLIPDFLKKHITGWRGQTIILVEDGSENPPPADFSPEALDAMNGIHGLSQVIFRNYLIANGVEGKVKNSK